MIQPIRPDSKLFASGGLICFAGGTNPFKAGIEGALLSGLIGTLTGSKLELSHSGLVPPQRFWTGADKPGLIESTEWNGVSGPQYNDLTERLHLDYVDKGGHAWLWQFLPEFEPDWDVIWKQAQTMFGLVKVGKLHYSVKRLFADACDRNVGFALLPVAGVLNLLAEHDTGVVCSECAGLLMDAGGVRVKAQLADIPWLPKVTPVPGQAIGCSPEDLVEMPLYASPVAAL